MANGYIDRGVSRISWPAVFAGTFVFLAIEVTFGVLGTAIFASAANPSSPHPVTGMSAGIGIWLVILSIIALYFGGRAAATLSNTTNQHVGMYHGLVTFGLSVFTTILLTGMMLGSTVAAGASVAAASPATIGDVVATAGYWLFIALVLGMLAAAMGGSHATPKGAMRREEATEPHGIHRVA